MDRHVKTGFPLQACVETAAKALRSDLSVSARTFAKSASHARALAAYGRVGSISVADLAAALNPAAHDYGAVVADLVDQIDLDLALYRRREGRARPAGPHPQVSAAVEALPMPLYMTDPQGGVIYFNAACVAFAGRQLRLGLDRWHIAWKLYALDGEHVPHDRCGMAQSLRERRSLHWCAIAERPDGRRVRFAATPTPLFGPDGDLLGAVNVIFELESMSQAPQPTRRDALEVT